MEVGERRTLYDWPEYEEIPPIYWVVVNPREGWVDKGCSGTCPYLKKTGITDTEKRDSLCTRYGRNINGDRVAVKLLNGRRLAKCDRDGPDLFMGGLSWE